ncbi:MAG: VWA domain-containing protein [Desulfobaccales bacterium]
MNDDDLPRRCLQKAQSGYVGMLLSLALILGVCLIPGTALAIKVHLSQVDKTDFPAIRLFADIEDQSRKPAKDMSKSDFQVYENKKLVKILDFADPSRAGPMTTVLVVDCSGSMNSAGKMPALKLAAANYTRYIKKSDRLGIIAFADTVQKLQTLTDDKDALIRALQSLTPNGKTAFYDAVYEATKMISKVKGRKLVLAITDGMDNSSSKTHDKVVELSRKFGVPVYAIGLGQKESSLSNEAGINEEALRRLAEETGGLYYFAPAAEELLGIYEHLSRQFHGGYELTYNSPNVMRDGTTREVELTATVQGTSATGRNSYYIPGIMVVVFDPLLFWAFLLLLLALAYAPAWRARSRRQPIAIPSEAIIEPGPRRAIENNIRTIKDKVPSTASPRVEPKSLDRQPDAPPPPVSGFSLQPLGQALPRQTYSLRKGDNFIGSAPGNDLVAAHPSVSPRHANICWEDDQFVIYDLQSQQGTFVSLSGDLGMTMKVDRNLLRPGAVVKLGEVLFRLIDKPL